MKSSPLPTPGHARNRPPAANQILAGKLNHVALCILPARRFMGRILTALRNSPQTGYTTVPRDVNLDIAWFSKYAEACNGRYLLRPITEKFYIECDACLEGGGGRILLTRLLQHPLSPSRLEALNLLMAIKTLVPPTLTCTEIVIKTDNIASAFSLTTGKSKPIRSSGCHPPADHHYRARPRCHPRPRRRPQQAPQIPGI